MLVCLACYGERVAALLETTTDLRLYRAQGDSLTAHSHRPAPGGGVPALIGWLRASQVGLLICGGLTCCALEALHNSGVQVVPWIGGMADEVARAWWSGSIQTMRMPGCLGCGQGRRWRGHGKNKQGNEEQSMDKGIIAVTSEGPKLTDMVDPRFGRAAGFVMFDLATGTASYRDNGGSQAMAQGAGIQAAENVARAGAGVVLSGFVGPKAFQALSAAGIKVVQNVENMTVGQAVEMFRRGELAVAEAPNAPAGGHKG